ncbi:MAG: PPOX class F420-dependent oxidoreductase [Caldilineales bacterium]|nr:PPOX class F420-dependent oxidoreductase [Caldilineales bacterium]
MPTPIPPSHSDLVAKKAFAHLVTLMPDGSPQVSPVWWEYDGAHIIVNSAKGRVKDRNIRRDPRVALSILDPDNPYRYLQIRGEVVEITEEGGDAGIDRLAKKYMGADATFTPPPGEVRVIYKIAATNIQTSG